jgi:hypothetical protein
VLKRHPLCDELKIPPPKEADIEKVKQDMEEDGWDKRYPSWTFQGKMIVGNTREAAAARLKIKPHRRAFRGTTDQAKRFILRSEWARRHMTPDEQEAVAKARRARVADLRERGDSIRTIAEKEKVSTTTIQNDLKASGVNPFTPDGQVTGSDGKKYDAQADDNRCGKCKRSFPTSRISVKNCEACKRLRVEAAARRKGRTEPGTHEPSRPAKPRSGAAAYDMRRFNSAFGQLTREIDVVERTYRARGKGDKVREALGTWRTDVFIEWFRSVSAPEPKTR